MNQEKMQRLQAVEQSLQSFEVQKHTARNKHLEAESALAELGKSTEAYRIIGNIMVQADQDSLVAELEENAAKLKNRVETLEKQESRLREEAKALQEELMKEMGEQNE